MNMLAVNGDSLFGWLLVGVALRLILKPGSFCFIILNVDCGDDIESMLGVVGGQTRS